VINAISLLLSPRGRGIACLPVGRGEGEEFPSLAIFSLPYRQARGVRGDFQKKMSSQLLTSY